MCMCFKFIGSVFSFIVSACSSAGAVLARTTTCHAGGNYVCVLYIYICVSFVSLSVFACV